MDKFPGDAALKKGLEDVKRDKEGPPPRTSPGMTGGFPGMGGGMGGLFGPEMISRMALNPKTRPYLNDKEFMAKIATLQRDPNSLPAMLSDPRIMEVLGAVLGGDKGDDDEEEVAKPTTTTTKAPAAAPKKEEQASMEVEEVEEEDEVEDLSPLTPEEMKQREEEKKKKQDQKAAVKAKERGNELYKSKKFDDAIAAYEEAIALDPTNMTFHNNKAAVHFTAKKYDDCIAACKEAVEVGKANRAPFEERAKALTRCAKAYQKKGDLENAIEMCKEAQLESYDKTTERMMKNMELEKKKADAAAYLDDDKAEESKQRGNEHFRNKSW